MTDTPERTGAPEIEVTPEMLAAADKVFRQFGRRFLDVWEMTTDEETNELYARLYRAMRYAACDH